MSIGKPAPKLGKSKSKSRLGARGRTQGSSSFESDAVNSAGSGEYARVRSDGTLGDVDEHADDEGGERERERPHFDGLERTLVGPGPGASLGLDSGPPPPPPPEPEPEPEEVDYFHITEGGEARTRTRRHRR